MKVLVLLLAFSSLAHAAPAWEICLDTNNYTLTVTGSFLNFVKLAKEGCTMRFLTMGGQGEKLEVNLCDANIHVDQFDGLETPNHSSYFAGSAGCPSPMFGADFNERAEDLQKFDAAKARVMAIMATVNKTYGKDLGKFWMGALKPSDLNSSEGKTACANYLVKMYLENCTAFEAKRAEPVKPVVPTDLPPGVHPAFIPKK